MYGLQRFRWVVALMVLFAVTGPLALARSSDQVLEIWPVISAPVGTQQSYLITQRMETKLINRDGILLLQPAEAFETSAAQSLLVTYTVIEPDVEGNIRLHVSGRPVHPSSARVLVHPGWEGVYRLDPERPVLETGTPPPSQFGNLMAPNWLYWAPSPHDLPVVRVSPGSRWRVSLPSETAQEPFEGAGPAEIADGMPSEAVRHFVGWESREDGAAIARVETITTGAGSHTTTDAFHVAAEVKGRGSLRLAVGELPWDADETKELTLQVEIQGPDGQHRAGAATTVTRTVLTIVRTDLESVEQVLPVQFGEVRDGILQDGGWDLGDGTQADVYMVTGGEREQVRIALESHEFDAYLLLLDETWNVLSQDNDSGGNGHALIDHVLPYTGTYFVVANTYRPDETGHYTLALQSFGRQVDATVLRETLYVGMEGVEAAIETADWDAVAKALEATAAEARAYLPLRITDAQLVAERPRAYGEYVPRATRVYGAGELVQVYLEPQNFHLSREGERYEIHLAVDAKLTDSRGNVVSEYPDVVVWNRLTMRPIRDVFLALSLWVPDVPAGSYVWQITVHDVVSGQAATAEVPILVSSQTVHADLLP